MSPFFLRGVSALALSLALAGCGDNEVASFFAGTGAPDVHGGSSTSSSSSSSSSSSGGGGGGGSEVFADFHTLRSDGLAPGQFEILTLSTLPDAVSGGDVLVGVRGLPAGTAFKVTRNDEDVTPVFRREASGRFKDYLVGLVSGLKGGSDPDGYETENTLTVTANGKSATLMVLNHPISGPVASGPHQKPFVCQTEAAGLGKAKDANCHVDTTYQWFYRSQQDQGFHALADPYAAYPRDVMRTQLSDGRAVPFVVRVETSVINRGIARIAVLDDPAARGAGKPFTPANWNRRVLQVFGESCGVGFRQGVNTPAFVLGGLPSGFSTDSILINFAGGTDRLGQGDIVMHSTLAAFGNHCNQLVSAETTAMVREHIIERYGPVEFMVGTNGSGAALQQYNAINNAPGLLDAAMPSATFADIITTAMTVTDCGQLTHYYRNSKLDWNDLKRAAVDGHLPGLRDPSGNGVGGFSDTSICASWNSTFFPNVRPDNCPGGVANAYSASNRGGVRCSIQEGNVNLLGIDPATGHANQPLDNVGIQYGLKALNDGVISFAEFADLNRNIGGLSDEGEFIAQRHDMPEKLARHVYRVGGIIGRGAIAETPVMDVAPYLDLIPLLNIHEAVRPFIISARLKKFSGQTATQARWRGVVTQPDAYPVLERWLQALRAKEATLPAHDRASRVAAIQASKPAEAQDSCVIGSIGGRFDFPAGVQGPLSFFYLPLSPGAALPNYSAPFRIAVPEDFASNTGPCQTALRVTTTPRMVAGMPMTDDVIKCHLKPVSQADYKATLTPAQLATLKEIFPQGVCDYSKPSVGDDGLPSVIWPSFGGKDMRFGADGMPPEPRSLRWRVGRSG